MYHTQNMFPMAKPSLSPGPSGAALRRRHRARVLASLLGVCEQLERLKVSREGRRACREVAGLLEAALVREAGRPDGASSRNVTSRTRMHSIEYKPPHG